MVGTPKAGEGLVTRTKPIRVSGIVSALECPLRYLLDTEPQDGPPLPESLFGLLGTAIHRACSEPALTGKSVSPSEVRLWISSDLERLSDRLPLANPIAKALSLPNSGAFIPQGEFV